MSGVEWNGSLDRDAYKPEFVAPRDRLADAARAGDWDGVFRDLDAGTWLTTANDCRIGGTSWFTPLHQAAYLGAPVAVVDELIRRGAWRSVRDAHGRRPLDLAVERGHVELVEALSSTAVTRSTNSDTERMTDRLMDLIGDVARPVLASAPPLRRLHVDVLVETGREIWFPIPGMYGGFSIALFRGRVHVESWSRVVGGSGKAHVITADRTTLVDDGFV